MYCAKTAKGIDMPFGVKTCRDSTSNVLEGVKKLVQTLAEGTTPHLPSTPPVTQNLAYAAVLCHC